MAKVRQNIVVQGLSGSLGDQLVIKQDRAGRTIVSAKPAFNPNRGFSDSQKSHQVSFREAAAYAQAAQSNPLYIQKAAGTPRSAYNVAMGDWFHAPEILEVDLDAWSGRDGQVIRIKAIDDVQVTQVTVTISGANDVVREQGAATQVDGLWWQYITTMGFLAPQRRLSPCRICRDISPHKNPKPSMRGGGGAEWRSAELVAWRCKLKTCLPACAVAGTIFCAARNSLRGRGSLT